MTNLVCGLLVPSFLCLLGVYTVAILLPGDPLMACDKENQPGLNVTWQPCPCSALVRVPSAVSFVHGLEPSCDPLIIAVLGTTLVILTVSQLVSRYMDATSSNTAAKALSFGPGEIPGAYWATRIESPQKRWNFWLKYVLFAVLAVCLWGLCVFGFVYRRWLEGGYVLLASVPSIVLAVEARAALLRIDEQGFLPVRLITSRFDDAK